MAVGNTERVSFYDAKLKEAEEPDDSIPGSIPRTPPTATSTPVQTTATTSTEDDDDEDQE